MPHLASAYLSEGGRERGWVGWDGVRWGAREEKRRLACHCIIPAAINSLCAAPLNELIMATGPQAE